MRSAYLGSYLAVAEPGSLRPRLREMATFRRRGRVPTGERREVCVMADGLLRRSRPEDTVWLPRGLWPQVADLAPMPLEDRRLSLPEVSFGFHGDLRAYQWDAVADIYRQGGGVLISPPGSGKTVMGMALVAAFRQPTTFLVHTKDLARQAEARARALFNLPPRAIGYIGGDAPPTFGTHLTIAMVQTVAKSRRLREALAKRTGSLFQDEAGHVPAISFHRVVQAFPARYRVGLTATIDRSDGLGPLAFAVLGPHRHRIPLQRLVALGYVVRPSVRVVDTGFGCDDSGGWAGIQRARATSGPRNRLLCSAIRQEFQDGHHCLVLVELKRHAARLAEGLRRFYGVPAEAVMGEVPAAVRPRIYARAQRERTVLVATKLADEGLDLPFLDRLFVGAAGRSQGRVEQQSGRVMRPYPGKRDAVVYDLADRSPQALDEQYGERIRIYRELEFPIQRWQVRQLA